LIRKTFVRKSREYVMASIMPYYNDSAIGGITKLSFLLVSNFSARYLIVVMVFRLL